MMKTFLLMYVVLHGGLAILHDDTMGYEDIQTYNVHPCKRPCQDDEPPMVCEYDFLLEHYRTLTKACYDCPFNKSDCYRPHCIPTDGSSRGMITVNRMIPGPGIHVCEGDTIRVRVHNKMEMSEGVTIHWHGVHQKGTPYMDGTNMVTQCPITAHTAFTYTFNASTPGTHFWHAHSGIQIIYGVFGLLVIRQPPRKEPHIKRYDLDLPQHSMLVNHWYSTDVPTSFFKHPTPNEKKAPMSFLVNGRGMNHEFYDPKTGLNVTTPREEFTVKKGLRYRMRVVTTGLDCPMKISIDDHVITIIASDGNPVEPMDVESVTIQVGERYDFILHANQNTSTYLIRIWPLGLCDPMTNKTLQTAILKYEGAPEDPDLNPSPPELNGKELNPWNTAQSSTKIPVTELRSLGEDDDPALTRQPDKKIVVGMDFRVVNNPRFHNEDLYSIQQVSNPLMHVASDQWNNMTMMLPPAPPLSQLQDIPRDLFCNKDNRPDDKDCGKEFCECVHMYKVDLGDVVEVILVDEGRIWDANHPTHLHGHSFRVVAMGKLGPSTWATTVEELDKSGNITRNLDRPPSKDTVSIPDGGYTVIRFHANNPGFWLFHCHIALHAEAGMALVFQVGNVTEFPSVPPRFPRCGSWDGYGQSTK